MPDRMPQRMWEYIPESMSDRMSGCMPERMSDRISEYVLERMSDKMGQCLYIYIYKPYILPDDMSETMAEQCVR